MGKILSKIVILIVAMSAITFTQIVSAELQMIDLGTLPGRMNSNAYGINDRGQIVGASDSNAFIWQDSLMTDLGTLPGTAFTGATSINEMGLIVGNSAIFVNVCCQGVLLQNGEWLPLGTLPGDTYSKAQCINNSGQIVGESTNSELLRHAFIWQDGMMTNLGTLGGTGHSFAYAINNSSQVVGGASTYDGFYHAFLWQDGIMTDLGTLGGSYSYATGINNLEQIVGYSQTSNGFFHAFLWQDGAMMDLGTIGEPTYPGSSYANDINDAGKVVGYSSTSTGVTHAFLWQNGIMTDLGSLGGNFSYASAINNVGQVVGYSSLPSGYSHAVLWKEEPLMITATAGVGGIISPSGDVIVNYGSNQTFTITPDKYYRILDVIVDGESVGSIKRYTFYDVTKDHAITATFVSTNIAVERPCELPDFGSASFTTPLIINNPYFPLVPGTTFLYEPRPNEDNVVNTIVVTDGIKNILGINCVVVHDYETVNGVLTEDTLDWYAQDDKGNIWYFGEDTKTYLCCDHGDPNCIDTTGSWEAGKDSALPGYLMLAKPRPGVCYQQESAEDAQDRAKVLRLNAKVSIDYGDFEDCLKTKEWIPLAPGEIEHKYYAPGVGLVLIKELKGKTVRVELIDKY